MNGEPVGPLEGQPNGAEVAVKRKRGRPRKQAADEPPSKRGRPAGASKNGAVQPPQSKRARPLPAADPQPTRVQPFRRRSSLLAAAKREGHELQANGEPTAVDEQPAAAQSGATIDGVESAATDGVPREQIVLPPPPSPPQPTVDHRIGIRINGHVPPPAASAPHQPHVHSTTNVNGVEVVTLSSSSPISAGSSSITIPPPVAHKTPPLITASDTTHSSKTAPLLADAALEPEDTQDASESSSLHQLPLNEEPSTSTGRPRRVKTPLPSAAQRAGGSKEQGEANENQTEGTVRLCIPAHTVDSMNARRLNCDKWELKVDFPEASADFTRTKQLLELMASDCAHKRPPDVHQFAPNDFRRLSAQIDFVADLWKRMTAVCDLNENLRLKQLEIKAVVEAVPPVDGDESDADSMGVRFNDDEAEEFSLEAEIEQIDKQKRIRRSTRSRAPQDEVRFLETDGDDSADEATNAVPPPSDEKFRHEQFLSTGVRNDCLIGIKLTPPHSTSNYRTTAAEQRRSEGMQAGLVNQHVSNDPWNPKASVDWWAVRLINNYDETQQRFYD